VLDFVNQKPADKRMVMEVGYMQDSEECLLVETNFMRELTYNIEHAVHHMAIMKIGIREVAPDTVIPKIIWSSGFYVALPRRHRGYFLI
jgi:hypothetical protein